MYRCTGTLLRGSIDTSCGKLWPDPGGGCVLASRSTTGARRGMSVQVDPMEPKLKAPRTKRLKLKYDKTTF